MDESTFLQDGKAIVAAGYCLFSATTVLVLTHGKGVNGFTLDPDCGKFLHTLKDIRIPRRGNIFSFNEANYRGFDQPVQEYLNLIKERSGTMTARYIGALVADVHNVSFNRQCVVIRFARSNLPDASPRLSPHILLSCVPNIHIYFKLILDPYQWRYIRVS